MNIVGFEFFQGQPILIMLGFFLGACLLVSVTYVQGTGNICVREQYFNPNGVIQCTFVGHRARENNECIITCNYAHVLKGAKKVVCQNGKWSGSLGDCQVITCPALSAVPLASVSPRSCLTRPSMVDDMCVFTCPAGYHGKGHWGRSERRFCKVNGGWYGNDTICEDGQRPDITCPKDISVSTEPGKATAKIKLSRPAYSDNSQNVDPNAKLVFKSTVPLQSNMTIGRHYVRFTVEDSAGLQAACNFLINVQDKEQPKIYNCPSDITKVIDDSYVRVFWNEPKVTDNAGEVSIYLNIPNRSEFYLGTTTVTYNVVDKSLNTNQCSFQVTIKQTCKDTNLPPSYPQCSTPAADLSKCDSRIPLFPLEIKWKDLCRKTCSACD